MPETPKPKAPPKGKGLGGIPTWGWIAAIGAGLVIGYIILKRSGTSSSTTTPESTPSPLGQNDSGSGGGGGVSAPPLQNTVPSGSDTNQPNPATAPATTATGDNQNPTVPAAASDQSLFSYPAFTTPPSPPASVVNTITTPFTPSPVVGTPSTPGANQGGYVPPSSTLVSNIGPTYLNALPPSLKPFNASNFTASKTATPIK